MRLILTLLALANLRWALAENVRAGRLYDEGDAALAQATRRRETAERLIARALGDRPKLAPRRAC